MEFFLEYDKIHKEDKVRISTGEIASSRYKSYLQILQGEEANYRTDSYDTA